MVKSKVGRKAPHATHWNIFEKGNALRSKNQVIMLISMIWPFRRRLWIDKETYREK